jgi:hypothetical protein
MSHTYYNTTENLTGIMLEFGKYTLKYEPPGDTPEDHSVEMVISSEANLSQMLEFFSSFLRAAGYEFDGKELCLEREAPDFGDISDFGTSYPGPAWADSGASYWGGYPQGGIAYKGAEGAQATGGKGAE